MSMPTIAGHRIAGLLAAVTALAWLLGGTAAAEPVPSVPVTIKQPVKLMVCDRGGEAEIKLHREYITTIYVPFPVTGTLPADTTEEDQFTFWYHEEYLRVRPNSNSVPGDHSSFDMHSGSSGQGLDNYSLPMRRLRNLIIARQIREKMLSDSGLG